MNRFARTALCTITLAAWITSSAASAAAQASIPRLVPITAPFVGQTFRLDLEGAVPGSVVRLWSANQADSTATPFGVLELRRDALHVLAVGAADGAGKWSFALPIPLDATLAEKEAHFQALVDDPAAPGGKVFSAAVHARILGPRVYATYGSFRHAGVLVLSAVTDAVVARVDCRVAGPGYGFPREGKPVFDAAFSRGAAMISDRELVVFDPFFGATLARIGFSRECARTLFTDPDRRKVFVLELAGPSSPARVHAIDLDTTTETAWLDLQNAIEPMWCQGGDSADVFVAEYESGGRTAIRRIGLLPLLDRGSIQVGVLSSNSFRTTVPLPLLFAEGQVFVSTQGNVGPHIFGSLTRCAIGAAGMSALVTSLGSNSIHSLEAVPAAHRLIGGIGATEFGPYFHACELWLGRNGPPQIISPPQPTDEFAIHEVEADGTNAWVIAERTWGGQAFLYRLDVPTHTWTAYPHAWTYGPSDAEVVRDAWDHEVWVANVGVAPPVNITPEILVVDELHGTTRTIALDVTVTALHAVPLP